MKKRRKKARARAQVCCVFEHRACERWCGTCLVKRAGPKAGPFQGRKATEMNFAGASEVTGGPCEELLRCQLRSASQSGFPRFMAETLPPLLLLLLQPPTPLLPPFHLHLSGDSRSTDPCRTDGEAWCGQSRVGQTRKPDVENLMFAGEGVGEEAYRGGGGHAATGRRAAALEGCAPSCLRRIAGWCSSSSLSSSLELSDAHVDEP